MVDFAADFESYFLNEKLSDVSLVLREEDGRKRRRRSVKDHDEEIVLPGHSMVLLASSGFCRTKVCMPQITLVCSAPVQPVFCQMR